MTKPNSVNVPAPQEPTPPADNPPADAGGTPIENPPAGGSRTYTEEELDAVVKRRIDKQNAKHAEKMGELEQRLAEEEASNQEMAEKIAVYEKKEQRHAAVEKVATETGLAPAQIKLLSGDTEEELLAAANAFKAASPNPYPVIKGDGGDPTPPAVTKESIYAIKNREERVRAMATHPELFD